MGKPVLSFCIPTFNRAQQVYACVSHILLYEGDEIEVVVTDNDSNDNTIELLGTINDDRLRVFKNDFNMITVSWPVAVSRANGRWAALMSDEDIVQIDNIPYFIDMLKDAEERDFAGVIYSYPPLSIRSYYECENKLKSIIYACFFSGHITGHIINMKYYELKELRYYLGCQMPTDWEVYKKYGEPTSDSHYISNPPVAEPQQEIFLCSVQNRLVKIVDVPLCCMGKDLVLTQKKVANFNPKTVGGRSLQRYNVIARARLYKVLATIENIKNAKDDALLKYVDSAVFTMFLDNVSITALTAAATAFGKDIYRPEHMKLAQQYYQYSMIDVIKLTLASANEVHSIITPFYSENAENYFKFIVTNLESVLEGKFDIELPEELPLFWQIKIGDFFFQILLRVRTTIVMEYDEDGLATKRVGTLEEDLGELGCLENALEFLKTDKMIKLLRADKDYDGVIKYAGVKNFRAHYLRAEAYFKLNDWDNAKKEIDLFLSCYEKAKTVYEIITGIPSVLYSYFFLGHIYARDNNQHQSIENFAKFYDLCDQFMLREMLERSYNMLPRKRVLLTGSTGFLGKNVADELGKIFDVAKPDRSKLDLLDTAAVREFLERQRYDAIIHFANPTGHNPIDLPDELFANSLKVFTNLSSCSDFYGKMIYIGSGAEYGKHRSISQISEDEFGQVVPKDDYGLSRYVMNEIAAGKDNIYNLRLFGCFGVGDLAHKVIPYVVNCIKEGKEIGLKENKKFDYLFAEDLIPVLAYFVENKPRYKSYNLCSGETHLISEVVEDVRRLMKSDLPIVFENDSLGLEYTASNERLRAEIPDWEPTKVREAIKKIVLKEFL